MLGNRTQCRISFTRTTNPHDNQARAHVRGDVVKLLPGRPATQDPGHVDSVLAMFLDDGGECLLATRQSQLVRRLDVEVAHVHHDDPGLRHERETYGELKRLFGVFTEVGPTDDWAEGLHGAYLAERTRPVLLDHRWIWAGVSNPRWMGAPNAHLALLSAPE